jgi:esterase/lipase superfamily enzyme
MLDLIDRQCRTSPDHMVAHSMGGRIAVMALSLVAMDRDVDGRGPMIDELILAAPEIRPGCLRPRRPVSTTSPGVPRSTSSRADRALLLAGRYTGDYSAGDAANTVLLLPGIETIDATEIRDDFSATAITAPTARCWPTYAPAADDRHRPGPAIRARAGQDRCRHLLGLPPLIA